MYDRQFWFHPETGESIILEFFLDGSINIDGDGQDIGAMISKINEMGNDDFEQSLIELGFQYMTNLNLPTFTIKGANNE